MTSELIVLIFPSSGEAELAWQFTEILRDRELYGLIRVTLTDQDSQGHTTYRHYYSTSDTVNQPQHKMLQGLVKDLLGDSSVETMSRLAGAGMDELFLDTVANAFGPDHSALLVYLPTDSLADTEQLMEFLNLMDATICRTSLPQPVENALLRLYADDL